MGTKITLLSTGSPLYALRTVSAHPNFPNRAVISYGKEYKVKGGDSEWFSIEDDTGKLCKIHISMTSAYFTHKKPDEPIKSKAYHPKKRQMRPSHQSLLMRFMKRDGDPKKWLHDFNRLLIKETKSPLYGTDDVGTRKYNSFLMIAAVCMTGSFSTQTIHKATGIPYREITQMKRLMRESGMAHGRRHMAYLFNDYADENVPAAQNIIAFCCDALVLDERVVREIDPTVPFDAKAGDKLLYSIKEMFRK